ncbi:mediator of RNA polymerase II transcription subunit 15-like [Paramacrobiotus metropolitanus]|uniref:mediator of RNA polymerase II transcription subunit 15-like n=1 Tax=Paramacrobiotus metropolitanus TaxID=2943436 RepID=UPI002446364B|nr:mediator of RNA polymerase II transcription subunit 15-like [Paramacrobiotus metropolitanus]
MNQGMPMDWKSQDFRKKCVAEMEKILHKTPGTNISASELESRIFQKATSREEYVNYVKACLTKVPLQMANRAQHQTGQQPTGPGMSAPSQQPQSTGQPPMYPGGEMQQQQLPQAPNQPPMGMMPGQGAAPGQNFGMMPGYPNQPPSQQAGQMGQFAGQPPAGAGYPQPQHVGGGMMMNPGMQGQQGRPMMMASGGMGMQGQPGMMQRQPMQQFPSGQPGMRGPYPEGVRTAVPQNMTPEQQQQMRQQLLQHQERIRMERANAAMLMRDNQGMINQNNQPYNAPAYPGSMQPRMPMMPNQPAAPPSAAQLNQQPSLLTQLISAPIPPNPQFRPSGPVGQPPGQGQPGNIPQQPDASGTTARPPSVVALPPKSSPMGMTGPPSNQPGMAPSPAGEINPDTVPIGSELYKKKLEELQKFKDVIQRMLLKFRNDPERHQQLERLRGLQTTIYEKFVPYNVLLKCEGILRNFNWERMGLGESSAGSPLEEKTPGSLPGLTPLIGADTVPDALVRVERPSLKPVAEVLSRVLTELKGEQFSALCQAWRARLPAHLDDGVVWRHGDAEPDAEKDLSDADEEMGLSIASESEQIAKWAAEIPAALQLEAGYLQRDFDIILDVDMHPDGELIRDAKVLYLCCGLKNHGAEAAVVPPVGVVVPLDYPKTLIDYRDMDVAAYGESAFLKDVRGVMWECFTGLGAGNGCSLVDLMDGWRQSLVAVQNRS